MMMMMINTQLQKQWDLDETASRQIENDREYYSSQAVSQSEWPPVTEVAMVLLWITSYG